jgi:hypothetical protein
MLTPAYHLRKTRYSVGARSASAARQRPQYDATDGSDAPVPDSREVAACDTDIRRAETS